MHLDDTEEWRPTHCAPDYYEVSNLGRVRRAAYSAPLHGRRTWPGRLLKTDRGPFIRYQFVYLACGATKIRSYVHTLVAEAFLEPRPTPSHTVNHIDGDPTNNHIQNLEWATPLEQIHDAMRRGTADLWGHKSRPRRGGTHPRAILTEDDVRFIRSAYGRFSMDALAAFFGVDRTTISSVWVRKNWRHVED